MYKQALKYDKGKKGTSEWERGKSATGIFQSVNLENFRIAQVNKLKAALYDEFFPDVYIPHTHVLKGP